MPLDLREVCRDERDLPGVHEIDQRWAGEDGGVQPERTVRNEVVGAGAAQEVTTRSAASNAARGEHTRKKERGSYKVWRANDNARQLIAAGDETACRIVNRPRTRCRGRVRPSSFACDEPGRRNTRSSGPRRCRRRGTTSRRTSGSASIADGGRPISARKSSRTSKATGPRNTWRKGPPGSSSDTWSLAKAASSRRRRTRSSTTFGSYRNSEARGSGSRSLNGRASGRGSAVIGRSSSRSPRRTPARGTSTRALASEPSAGTWAGTSSSARGSFPRGRTEGQRVI